MTSSINSDFCKEAFGKCNIILHTLTKLERRNQVLDTRNNFQSAFGTNSLYYYQMLLNLILTFTGLFATVNGLSFTYSPSNRFSFTTSPISGFSIQATRLNLSSKEDEIAYLEEKIKRLKEEQLEEVEEESTEKKYEIPSSQRNTPVANNLDEPFAEMLSEQWKEKNSQGDDDSGVVVKAVGAIALLVGLAFFSQVPVGQEDLDKYSTAKPNTSIDLGSWKQVRED